MSSLIEVILLIAGSVNIALMFLMFAAYRKRLVHFWFAVLSGSIAAWAFCINGFLSISTDVETGSYWVRGYYVAAALIIYALLEFSLHFPRRIPVSKYIHAGIFVVFAGIVATVLWQNGLIGQVVIHAGEPRIVHLHPLFYFLYIAYYIIMIIITSICFAYGIYETRRRRRQKLSRWLLLLTLSIAASLVFGAWFNLFLPLLGDYTLIWAGPPFSLIFCLTALFAIAKQGILDLRQVVVRTLVYLLLVATLVAIYSTVVFGVARLFISPLELNFTQVVFQAVVAIFLAFTVHPIKQFFDKITNQIFYRDEYSSDEVLEVFRNITTNEVKTGSLVNGALETLRATLHPRFATLYVYHDDKAPRQYTKYSAKPTPHQHMLQDTIADLPVSELPEIIDQHTINNFTDIKLRQLFLESKTVFAIQLIVRKQRVAFLLFGAKQSGKNYDVKDQRLLATIADELSLAIQNSLRFHEIELFNTTLQQRIDEATEELRKTNLQLQRLDEAKDEFVSMASHQLRTPLTSVKGYISMVLEGDVGRISATQRKLLSEAFTSSERMVHLINDFLNVSRLQTGKFIVDRRPVDLAKIIRQEVDSLRTTAEAHSLVLNYRMPSVFPVLYLDEGKIRQVVMNFLDNAIYYSREHTKITISLRIEEGYALLEVRDTGIGVPIAEQAHLFTKFFRATNARRQRPDGTGVGLFLAKKVIVAHGGTMIFESKEGEGSVFGFRLPVKKLSTAPAEDTNQLDNEPHNN